MGDRAVPAHTWPLPSTGLVPTYPLYPEGASEDDPLLHGPAGPAAAASLCLWHEPPALHEDDLPPHHDCHDPHPVRKGGRRAGGLAGWESREAGTGASAFSDSIFILIFLPVSPTHPPATSCCPESLKPNTWTPWMLSTEPLTGRPWPHPFVGPSWSSQPSWDFVGRCGCLGVLLYAAPPHSCPNRPRASVHCSVVCACTSHCLLLWGKTLLRAASA